MKMKYVFYTVSTILLSALLIFGESIIGLKLELVSNIEGTVSSFFSFGSSGLKLELEELRKENENLRTQILNESLTPANTFKVYSSYPQTNVRKIAIAAGKSEGIKEGDVATSGANIFVGRVEKVFETYSIVSTLFDPNMELAVRIGSKEVSGLFKGGGQLKVALIPKGAPVFTGDIVLSAKFDIPYGLNMGTVQSIADDKATPLREAIIEPAFKISELRNVEIRR